MRKRVITKIKQVGRGIAAVILASTLYVQTAKADESVIPYLINIQNYTNSILAAVNLLPVYLTRISLLATSMLANDNTSGDPVDWSANWANQQSWVATLIASALNNEATQYTTEQALLVSFFGASNLQASTPVPLNVNDLSYMTLLGQPLVSPDPRTGVNAAMNYLINASSLGISLTPPGAGWRGDQTSQKVYRRYYNTVTAVQTYNAFVLSRLYADSQSMGSDAPLRRQLITQSSDSNWFTSITSNDLGWVLRQLLMYNSQMYVLLDQLVQNQKQTLASLAMTNSLIIASNEISSSVLLQKAQGSL